MIISPTNLVMQPVHQVPSSVANNVKSDQQSGNQQGQAQSQNQRGSSRAPTPQAQHTQVLTEGQLQQATLNFLQFPMQPATFAVAAPTAVNAMGTAIPMNLGNLTMANMGMGMGMGVGMGMGMGVGMNMGMNMGMVDLSRALIHTAAGNSTHGVLPTGPNQPVIQTLTNGGLGQKFVLQSGVRSISAGTNTSSLVSPMSP
jgi:hypothetical protein